MRLVIRGLERGPAEARVAPEEIRRACPAEQNGCFTYSYEWGSDDRTFTLTFRTSILLSRDLSEAELAPVRAHENQHYNDFLRLVRNLQQAVTRALNAHRDPQLDTRLAWLDYDHCTASADFHRRIGHMPRICMQPSGERPQ